MLRAGRLRLLSCVWVLICAASPWPICLAAAGIGVSAAAACHSVDMPSLPDAEAERPIEYRGVVIRDRPPVDLRDLPMAAPVDAAALRGPAPRSFGVGDYDRPADFDPRRKPCACKPGDPLCSCP